MPEKRKIMKMTKEDLLNLINICENIYELKIYFKESEEIPYGMTYSITTEEDPEMYEDLLFININDIERYINNIETIEFMHYEEDKYSFKCVKNIDLESISKDEFAVYVEEAQRKFDEYKVQRDKELDEEHKRMLEEHKAFLDVQQKYSERVEELKPSVAKFFIKFRVSEYAAKDFYRNVIKKHFECSNATYPYGIEGDKISFDIAYGIFKSIHVEMDRHLNMCFIDNEEVTSLDIDISDDEIDSFINEGIKEIRSKF